MRIWIVRKHPRAPYHGGWLQAFTIHKCYATRAEAKKEAELKTKKSYGQMYTVGYVEIKEQP